MRPMEHHTSPTLVCDRSDTTQLLITRLYELCPTTLPDKMTFRLLTHPPAMVVVPYVTWAHRASAFSGEVISSTDV